MNRYGASGNETHQLKTIGLERGRVWLDSDETVASSVIGFVCVELRWHQGFNSDDRSTKPTSRIWNSLCWQNESDEIKKKRQESDLIHSQGSVNEWKNKEVFTGRKRRRKESEIGRHNRRLPTVSSLPTC